MPGIQDCFQAERRELHRKDSRISLKLCYVMESGHAYEL